jgi:hypothetical protein
LNEFCLNTGRRRKYAIRLLYGHPPGKQPKRRVRRRKLGCGHEVLSILTAVWEAAGYLVGATESALSAVNALDPEAIQGGEERGAAVAVDPSSANGSPAASEQDAAEEPHLRVAPNPIY